MASRGRVPNNTTSISLHERFSKLRTAAGGQKVSGKLQGARNYATQLQKALRQNNRAAQQMDRRNAAISAALKLKKKSIKQRLGATNKTALAINSKARINTALRQKKLALARSPARSNLKTVKKSITAPTVTKNVRGKGTGRILTQTFTRGGGQASLKLQRNRNNTQSSVAPTRGQKSPRGRGRGTGRGALIQKTRPTTPNKVNRNQNQRGRENGQKQRGHLLNQQNNQPQRGRGQGRGRARGRGQRGRGGPNKKVSKEDLDKQLDQYMSKTRHALDQDLEKYMSNMGSGDVDMN